MPNQRRRFQFSLRTLFIINIGFALVFGAIRAIVDGSTGALFLLAPGLWLLGIIPVVVLTALGDVCAGRSGAVIGAVVSGVLCGILMYISSVFVDTGGRGSTMFVVWNVQCLIAIVLTVLSVIQSVWQSRRAESFAGDAPAQFVQRLSDVRERNLRLMAWRWKRDDDSGAGDAGQDDKPR